MKNLLLTRSLSVLGAIALLAVALPQVPVAAQTIKVTVTSQEPAAPPAPPAAPESKSAPAPKPAPPSPPDEYVAAASDYATVYNSFQGGGLGGGAFGGGLGGFEGGADDIDSLEKQVAETNAAIDNINKSGPKDDSEKGQLRNLQAHKAELVKRLERLRRLEPLQKKVDVKFTDATLAQAADALSKAAGVTISVEGDVPDSTRLTVEARRVRLSTVLESIARQASLIIEPVDLEDASKPLGVLLTMPPMLRVNDVTQKFPTPLSPWSDKWGTPPTRRFFITTGLPANITYEVNNSMRDALRDAQIARATGQTARAIASNNLRIAGTALGALNTTGRRVTVLQSDGNTTVTTTKEGSVTVIETGKNNKGEKGTWTTVYALKDGELKKQSRNFKKD